MLPHIDAGTLPDRMCVNAGSRLSHMMSVVFMVFGGMLSAVGALVGTDGPSIPPFDRDWLACACRAVGLRPALANHAPASDEFAEGRHCEAIPRRL